MRKVKIDLRLKFLPKDQVVCMVRPGSGYHLYEKFHELSLIAPDVPFLEVEDGKSPSTIDNLEMQLSRAVAFRAWQKKGASKNERPPSKEADSYALEVDTPSQSRTRLLNVAESILWDLPEGAVVFIPASSLYGEALIGELASRDAPRISFTGTGFRSIIKYRGRTIKNLRRVPMRSLPEEVTDGARLPTVIQKIEGYAKERLLRTYYGDFQLGNDIAMMEFEAREDKFDPITMARITALAVAIEHHDRTGVYVSPGECLFKLSDSSSLEVHANINSPNGKLLLEGAKKTPHILRSLLLAASLVSSGQATAQEVTSSLQSGTLEVHNTKDTSRSNFIDATESALINFAKAAGAKSTEEYIAGLAESSSRTRAQIEGEATIE